MVLVQRDEGEQTFGHLDFGRPEIAMRGHFDPHPHRRAADPFDVRVNRDQVAQMDRRDKLHPLDGYRRYRSVRPYPGNDSRGDVHLAQNPAAKDMAVGIDVGRARHHAQDRLAIEVDHSVSSSLWICGAA